MPSVPDDPYVETLAHIETLLGVLGVVEPVRAAIMALIRDYAPPASIRNHVASSGRAPRTIGEVARLFHRLSVQRNEAIGAVVTRDDRWNMLLDLFAAAEERRAISVSGLAIGAGSPATTALRHIEGLFQCGLVERVGDPDDRRRTWVRLTPEARDRMAAIITGFTIPRPDPLILKR